MKIIAVYGSENVVCPFYRSADKETLICEGVVTGICIQHFKSNRDKQEHIKRYCNTFGYKKCLYAAGLIAMYNSNLKETPGTFAKDTLLKYHQT